MGAAKRAFSLALAACMAIACVGVSGCYHPPQNGKTTTGESVADKSELKSVIDTCLSDADTYEMNDEMKTYISFTADKGGVLLNDDTATQDAVDQAVAQIKKARELAMKTAKEKTSSKSKSTESKKSTTPAPKSSEPKIDKSKSNALRQAKSYLKAIPFSASRLAEQLKYEGYSDDDITYAVDNCGADWNEQARLAAKSYNDITAFSHSRLVEQLVYDGFTDEQAEYGVNAIGL